MDRLERQNELAALAEKADDCTDCALSENRSRVVFAEGDVRAQLMIIGEAPGANEDDTGRPFIGRSGQFLRKTLRAHDVPDEAVYITNTVKCRPPNNRDPKSGELDSCRPYLNKQLDLVDPDVVLALGSFGLEYCLDESGVGAHRNEVYDWNDRSLVITYHPAYILRNRNADEKFYADVRLALKQCSGRDAIEDFATDVSVPVPTDLSADSDDVVKPAE